MGKKHKSKKKNKRKNNSKKENLVKNLKNKSRSTFLKKNMTEKVIDEDNKKYKRHSKHKKSDIPDRDI